MKDDIKITSFGETISFQRIIGKKIGEINSPTVIAFAGIHGNERAGIHALQHVFEKINKENLSFNGNFYGISGNLNAIKKNIRFESVDLNRIWTEENLNLIKLLDYKTNEHKEQFEIYKTLKVIFKKHKGPFYFLDLHTTSSNTQPFITISDSLNNREFCSEFTIPTILGIEEFLDGPLLTFINEYGHVALGFEAGQHYDKLSVSNCEAFIWQALKVSNCVSQHEIDRYYKKSKALFSTFKIQHQFFQIDYKYNIKSNENFKMNPGFENFQFIKKNQELALSNDTKIYSDRSGKIFMPLYQSRGNDGFFIISKLSVFWLELSKLLRKFKFYSVLTLLPGVRKHKENEYTLMVNPKIAKFLATEIFHLLGYRKKIKKDNLLYFFRRDRKERIL